MTGTEGNKAKGRRARLRFGLRSLLLAMLLIATYFVGWQSHRIFHNRNLEENIAAAMQEISRRNVKVETNEELGLIIIKGKRENVEAAQASLDHVRSAAVE